MDQIDITTLPEYPFRHPGVILRNSLKVVLTTDGYGFSAGHLCGYAAFPADQIPKEWHGNYHADGLQYLAIHGGITYCEVGGGDEAARSGLIKDVVEMYRFSQPAKLGGRRLALDDPEESPPILPPEVQAGMDRIKAKHEAVKKAALAVPYTYVTFGFDCVHAGDIENQLLRTPKYVMELVDDMERLLLAYSGRIKEWRTASRKGRADILDEINVLAGHRSNLGFGAIIGLLGGATELGPD